MITQVSEKGFNATKAFEGCSLRAYYCAAGELTIGYGNTNKDPTVREVLGHDIYPGLVITQEQADQLFDKSLNRRYLPAVLTVFGKECKQEHADVGADFHYNTGAIKRASWPKSLLKGDMPAVKASIMSWNKGGGKVLAGLTRRCSWRWKVLSTGDYGPEGVGKKRTLSSARVVHEGPGMLDKGDTGPEVAELQGRLVKLGLLPKGAETGTFDQATYDAVVKFQKSHPQLTADGVAGPATREALERAIDVYKKSVGTLTKVGGGGTATATATGAAVGLGTAKIILISTAIVVVAVLLYLAWQYKDELKARLNFAIDREAP